MRRRVSFDGEFQGCFGCGRDNAAGLRLSFWETEQGVETTFVAPSYLQGAKGVLHGGIQAALADETMCMAAYAKLGAAVVTGELKMRYQRPVPVSVPLRIVAQIQKRDARSAFIDATISLDGEEEARTTATGRFFFVRSEAQRGRE